MRFVKLLLSLSLVLFTCTRAGAAGEPYKPFTVHWADEGAQFELVGRQNNVTSFRGKFYQDIAETTPTVASDFTWKLWFMRDRDETNGIAMTGTPVAGTTNEVAFKVNTNTLSRSFSGWYAEVVATDVWGNYSAEGTVDVLKSPGTGAPTVITSTNVWQSWLSSLQLYGDVTGAYDSNTVVKIQGVAVTNTAPTDDQTLVYDAATSNWGPETVSSGGGTLAGDVTGAAATNTVVKLRNRSIATNTPSNGQVLKWSTANSAWEPQEDDGAGSVSISDAAYSDSWNTDTNGATKNSLFDYLVIHDTDSDGVWTDESWYTALLPLAGGTMTGDQIFNDNVKAYFGTGSDVSIVWDATDMRIISENVTANDKVYFVDFDGYSFAAVNTNGTAFLIDVPNTMAANAVVFAIDRDGNKFVIDEDGEVTVGIWTGTAIADAYVADNITASSYLPLAAGAGSPLRESRCRGCGCWHRLHAHIRRRDV